jgi:hypothetical protein
MSKTLDNILKENQQNSPTPNNSSFEKEPSLMTIVSSVLTPLVPALVAKLTGQKQLINTVNNDQNSLPTLTPVLQNMISTQNLLLQEIIMLKKNDQVFASNFQNFRLTHERKQIELGTNQGDFNKSTQFNPNQNQENYE